MKDERKTKKQLVDELGRMRQRVNELEASAREREQREETLFLLQKKLRSLATHSSLADAAERREIAIRLHDHVSQQLVACVMKLEELKKSAPSDDFVRALDEIRVFIHSAGRETRSLALALSPLPLYQLGFEATVQWLFDRVREEQGIRCIFEDDGEPKPLAHEVRILLFQAVREVVMNIVKHSRARRAWIALRRDAAEIRITIEDDGVGFDASHVLSSLGSLSGFGLFSVQVWLDHFGGKMDIDSALGSGTRVVLTAPLTADA